MALRLPLVLAERRWRDRRAKIAPVSLVAAMIDNSGKTNLFILPITASLPPVNRLAVEVSQIERRRAGLDDMPLWVMLDEYNHDILEASFYFDSNARIGRFSAAFHRRVLQTFVQATKERRTKRVSRTE